MEKKRVTISFTYSVIFLLLFSFSILLVNADKSGTCKNPNGGTYCGQKSGVSNCYCDNACTNYGDCCTDYKDVCLASGKCTDSDGGIDYYNKGTLVFNGVTYTDFCNDKGNLNEMYCVNGNTGYTSTEYKCPNGCKDGACTQIQGCSKDLKICPDGSKVERDPLNNCQFKPCPPPPSTNATVLCTDSDGGIDYYNKGTLVFNGVTYTDFCNDKGNLNEMYCVNGNTGYTSTEYKCPNGCKDGACVVSVCGNNICEEGEADYCPPCTKSNPPCDVACKIGTCPQDCKIQCYSYKDCPPKTSTTYCEGSAACTQTVSYTCINPGTPASSCVKSGGGGTCQICPNGCYNGACVPSINATIPCTDSDGGINIYQKGETKGFEIGTKEIISKKDYCKEGPNGINQLVEFYCDGPNTAYDYTYVNNAIQSCPNGCKDGACVVSNPTTKQDVLNWISKNCNDLVYPGQGQ